MSDQDTCFSILLEGIVVTCSVLKAMFIAMFRWLIIPIKRKDVHGEVVLVTGSGGAIGCQLSLEFSALGATVVLWDIDESSNEDTADRIRRNGGTCYAYTVDVGNNDEVHRTAQRVTRDVGEVSLLINNAGVVIGRKLLDCSEHEIESLFNVNLLAPFLTVKCFLPSMLRRNHGHIVNIASSAGLVGLKNLAPYSASKHGLVGFTEVLHYEIIFSGYDGVHTTLVCPSFVKTKLFDGCKYRFPTLLAPIEVDDCVDRIIHAVLTNQIVVCIPRMVYFFWAMKTILPVSAMNILVTFLGAAQFMDTFIGKDGGNTNNVPNGRRMNHTDTSCAGDATKKQDV